MKKLFYLSILSLLFVACGQEAPVDDNQDNNQDTTVTDTLVSNQPSDFSAIFGNIFESNFTTSENNIEYDTENFTEVTTDTTTQGSSFTDVLYQASTEGKPSNVVAQFGQDSIEVIFEDVNGIMLGFGSKAQVVSAMDEIFTQYKIVDFALYTYNEQAEDGSELYLAEYATNDVFGSNVTVSVIFKVKEGTINRVHFF